MTYLCLCRCWRCLPRRRSQWRTWADRSDLGLRPSPSRSRPSVQPADSPTRPHRRFSAWTPGHDCWSFARLSWLGRSSKTRHQWRTRLGRTKAGDRAFAALTAESHPCRPLWRNCGACCRRWSRIRVRLNRDCPGPTRWHDWRTDLAWEDQWWWHRRTAGQTWGQRPVTFLLIDMYSGTHLKHTHTCICYKIYSWALTVLGDWQLSQITVHPPCGSSDLHFSQWHALFALSLTSTKTVNEFICRAMFFYKESSSAFNQCSKYNDH